MRSVKVNFFFLQCRIAQDSCGHVPANSRSKRSRQLLPCSTKQNNTSPNQSKTKQHTNQGSGCSKRDVKRVARYDVRQPANSLFKSSHTLRCSLPENTIAKIVNPDPAQLSKCQSENVKQLAISCTHSE